jgi:hypothetical protein
METSAAIFHRMSKPERGVVLFLDRRTIRAVDHAEDIVPWFTSLRSNQENIVRSFTVFSCIDRRSSASALDLVFDSALIHA